MIYLNLSGSQFSGSVPIEIFYHFNLITLDLSNNYFNFDGTYSNLVITNRGLKMLAQNLTKLRQLVLDEVDMSAVSPNSFLNLSSSLMHLSTSSCSLQGRFPNQNFQLPSLIFLGLTFNFDFSGILPKFNWSSPLEFLSLSLTNFSGEIPDSIGNLKNLSYLDLSFGQFIGPIPISVGNLTCLTTLGLGANEFIGIIEFDLFTKLKSLEVLWLLGGLNLAYESLNYTFPRLESLYLIACNLTRFPYFLNSLKQLTYLNLGGNKIGGEIPTWFWVMAVDKLWSLDLSSNLLKGSLEQLPWEEVSSLEVAHKAVQRALPVPLPSPVMGHLDLSFNDFAAGEIPSSICSLTSLLSLNLAHNNFLGSIPQCFGNLTSLELLNLGGNKLDGLLPRSLVNCTALRYLYLKDNELSDIFPDWLQTSNMSYLGLDSNKFYGRINFTAVELSFPHLEALYVSNNNFGGWLPEEILSHNTLMGYIDLSSNMFEGPLPLPPPSTIFYLVANNRIRGDIPFTICNCTKLQVLDLSNNSLTGILPQCLSNFSSDLWVLNLQVNSLRGTIPPSFSFNLFVLNLRMNYLQGAIPESFSFNNSLSTIDMSHNQIEGPLPRMLANCKDLEVLDLSHNKIEDSFPDWLGNNKKLKVLVLKSNNFKGLVNILMTAHVFTNLRILDLSNNFFHGPIPVNLFMNLKSMINAEEGQNESLYMRKNHTNGDFYNDSVTVTMKGIEFTLVRILSIFTTIDLSNNSFEGNIPEVIGNLQTLKGLNLSHNHLIGSIPASLGRLTSLEWLDLSSNKLGGEIPKELIDLTSLAYLNLSENRLIGRIPQGEQWLTFSKDSFAHNPSLCGTQLSKACPGDALSPQSSSSINQEEGGGHESWFDWKFVCMGYAFGLIIGFSVGYIALETGRPEWVARMVGKWKAKRLKRPRRSRDGVRFGR